MATATPNQLARLNEFARVYDQVAGAYPSWIRRDVALAQAVLETGWFTSRRFVADRNAFGLRPSTRNLHSGVRSDHAVYASVADSIRDYLARQVQFNGNGYLAKASKQGAYAYIVAVQSTGYAEAPGYTDEILKLLRNYPELQKKTLRTMWDAFKRFFLGYPVRTGGKLLDPGKGLAGGYAFYTVVKTATSGTSTRDDFPAFGAYSWLKRAIPFLSYSVPDFSWLNPSTWYSAPKLEQNNGVQTVSEIRYPWVGWVIAIVIGGATYFAVRSTLMVFKMTNKKAE
jgi:hypothetical protein